MKGIAIYGNSDLYVTGSTASTDFPITAGAYNPSHNGGTDVFVTKLFPSGNGLNDLLYSTFLGGSDNENTGYGNTVTLDGSGNAYITGSTASIDFPITAGAYNPSHKGGTDVFVTKLSPSGNSSLDLMYSTFLGGNGSDYGNAIVIDESGNAYVTGFTTSTDFPTTAGAYDQTHNGASDAFVTKLGTSVTTGSISGIKFEDLNGNCIKDTNEQFLSGWTINLSGPVSTSTTTNSLGEYCFTSLPAGTYTVSEVLQSGWTQTCPVPPGTYTVILASGQQVTDKNFGNRRCTTRIDSIQTLTITVCDTVSDSVTLYPEGYILPPQNGVQDAGGFSFIPCDSGMVSLSFMFPSSLNCSPSGSIPVNFSGMAGYNTTGFSDPPSDMFNPSMPILISVFRNQPVYVFLNSMTVCPPWGISPRICTGTVTVNYSNGEVGSVEIPIVLNIDSCRASECPTWGKRYNNENFKKDENMGFEIRTAAKKMTRNLAVHSNGDVYVTGYGPGENSASDYVTIVYDQFGNIKSGWPQYHNGSQGKQDNAYALAIDASGNVYVTGESKRWGPGFDITTISYNANGNKRWEKHYSGPEKDAGYAIAVDPSGTYVYVTGETKVSTATTAIDYITICYDAAIGDPCWTKTYNGTGNGIDKAYAIAVCPVTGDVAVTGKSQGGGTNADIATVRYNSTGTIEVIYRFDQNNTANRDDYGFGITFNKFGELFVVGASDGGTATKFDYVTLKYGPSSWVKRYDNINRDDYGYHLATDDIGNVYVTGASKGVVWLGTPLKKKPTGFDYATVAYGPTGDQLWVHRYDGIRNADIARAITVCDTSVYVTGTSQRPPMKLDYVTLRLGMTKGNIIGNWSYNYMIIGTNNKDIAYDIATRPMPGTCCCVAVTGTSFGGKTTKLDFATMQYNGCDTLWSTSKYGFEGEDGEEEPELPGILTLYQSYPNPFNPITTIQFTLPEEAYVTLKVYNVLGQEVGKLFDRELLDEGEQEVEFIASNLTSGVYFYRIVAEGIGDEEEGVVGQMHVNVKKMLLLK